MSVWWWAWQRLHIAVCTVFVVCGVSSHCLRLVHLFIIFSDSFWGMLSAFSSDTCCAWGLGAWKKSRRAIQIEFIQNKIHSSDCRSHLTNERHFFDNLLISYCGLFCVAICKCSQSQQAFSNQCILPQHRQIKVWSLIDGKTKKIYIFWYESIEAWISISFLLHWTKAIQAENMFWKSIAFNCTPWSLIKERLSSVAFPPKHSLLTTVAQILVWVVIYSVRHFQLQFLVKIDSVKVKIQPSHEFIDSFVTTGHFDFDLR